MAEVFEFKSTKNSKVKLSYVPSGAVKISDKKAFEGYLKKVVDFIEVDKKEKPRVLAEEQAKAKPVKVVKPKPKVVEGLTATEDEEEEQDEQVKI